MLFIIKFIAKLINSSEIQASTLDLTTDNAQDFGVYKKALEYCQQ